MLNLIRDNLQSFGVKLIVALVALVMVSFGVTSYRTQSMNTIVTVGDHEVKLRKYRQLFEQAQNDARRRYKERAADYIKMVNLPAQILQQLTNNALLLKSAEKNGLAVTDLELAQSIYQNPAFQTDGRFDKKRYSMLLDNSRTDKISYEQDLRDELLINKYMRFLGSRSLLSRESVEREYLRGEAEVEFKAIEFVPGLFAAKAKVTDADIAAYYESHKENFQQKSQYVIRYFILGTADVNTKVKLRERELKKYYQRNRTTEFSTKESFLSRHILIAIPNDKNEQGMKAARELALKIYQDLLADRKKFAALAKEHSADSGSARLGGNLGWVEKGTFVAEFENAVNKLKKNGLSQPFLSNFGYHIVELIDKKAAVVQSFEEARPEIAEKIRLKKAKRRLKNLIAKSIKGLVDQPLENLAETYGKKTVKTVPFDDSSDVPGIGNSYQLYQLLKSKKLQEKGHHELPGEQGTMVYEVEAIVDPFVKPLKDVKTQIADLAQKEKEREVAMAMTTQYAASVKTLQQFEQLASELKTESKQLKIKFSESRNQQLRTGENFRNQVFRMNQGQVKSISEANRGFLVYMLTKTAATIGSEDKEKIGNMENWLRNQKIKVLYGGLIKQMREQVDVQYNNSIMQALNIKPN